MNDQDFLFNPYTEPMTDERPTRPDTEPKPIAAPSEDIPRLKGQNALILERLRAGSVTNRELAEISLKYTSRVSDVRKYLTAYYPGQRIECTKMAGGLTVYMLLTTSR